MFLSIITINLNNLRGLRRTLDSVLSQHGHQYEWIIIDGGSIDGSRELIEQHQQCVHYWESKPDRGLYHAMNKGLEVASGDYLLFLNSGDCFCDDSVVSDFCASHPSADVIYGNTIFVDKENKEVSRLYSPDFIRLSRFWHKGGLNHQSTFFRRKCFDRYRYNESNRIASDTELYMHLLYDGYSFLKWDRFIARFELGGESSVVTPQDHQEFNAIINRVLPPGIRADYEEIIQNRDVDLYILIRKIINSKRWVRNLARFVLFPFRLLFQ